jgi:hypothetical protein
MNDASRRFLAEMQAKVTTYFNSEEVETMAFVLGIDYDSLRGATKPTKVNALLFDVARNGRLPELLAHARRERANVEWPDMPAGFELPQGAAGSEAGGTTIQNINTGGGAFISGGTFNAGGNIDAGRREGGATGDGNLPAKSPYGQASGPATRTRFLQEVAALKPLLDALPEQYDREAGALARRVDLLAEELAADHFDGETVLDLAQAVGRAADNLAPAAPVAAARARSLVDLAAALAR